MFLKITRWTNGTLAARAWVADALYECKQVIVAPLPDKVEAEGPVPVVSVTMEGASGGVGTVTLVVDKRYCDIYILNAAGATIDSYRFSERYARPA